MTSTRFWLSTTSALVIFAGGATLMVPQAVSAAVTGCTSSQIIDAKAALSVMCDGYAGVGVIHCHENGEYHWDMYRCSHW